MFAPYSTPESQRPGVATDTPLQRALRDMVDVDGAAIEPSEAFLAALAGTPEPLERARYFRELLADLGMVGLGLFLLVNVLRKLGGGATVANRDAGGALVRRGPASTELARDQQWLDIKLDTAMQTPLMVMFFTMM